VLDPEARLRRDLLEGDRARIAEDVDAALRTSAPVDLLNRVLLGAMQELGRRFGAGELRAYMKTNYAAENMVFCAVGNVDHGQLVKMVETRLSGLQAKTSFAADRQHYTGGYFAEKRDTEQLQCLFLKIYQI
jgi:predicted Zn-dependent peptidase